jgi:pimeloyl-ACP methyl ester carboxylesterase
VIRPLLLTRVTERMRIQRSVLMLVSASLFTAFGQTLPAPTGSQPVGRLMLVWSDQTRIEDAGPTAGKAREVAAYVFYPANATGGSRVEYYPGLAGLENAPETRFLRQQFGGVWTAVTAGTIRTNAFNAPPMALNPTRFPVLIFSPGLLAPVLAYQLQFEELASHGYVVFGLEHGTDSALIVRPDRTLLPYVSRTQPDQGPPTVAGLEANRDQVIRKTADIVFAMDQIERIAKQPGSVFPDAHNAFAVRLLRNRLDLSRIGVFGHSEGGKAAIRACQIDTRVRACLNQDGEMFGIPFGSVDPIPSLIPGKPINTPVAVLYVAEPGVPDAQLAAVRVTRQQYEDWRAAKNRALRTFLQRESRNSLLVTITAPGYVHASFMDIRLLAPNPPLQAVTNHGTGTNITRAFFDARFRRGDQKDWAVFESSPGEGIKVERLGGKP